jgi:mRNA-degrading endonuclease RelE of RelBE toxin-antitoxin system
MIYPPIHIPMGRVNWLVQNARIGRIGDYRVIYHVFEKRLIVEIVRVRHRKGVYDK